MKCTIPEISWHNRDPVMSIDIQNKKPNDNFYRLASAGIDSHVLIWRVLIEDNGTVKLDCVSDLKKHQKAVNIVRFSPSGEYLASGDDEFTIIIWRQKNDQDMDLDDTDDNEEHWIPVKILRGHLNDIYDIAWSPDSTQIISGSVDNTAIIWDAINGKRLFMLKDHKNFVQGVAWNPKYSCVATLSNDGKCRMFNPKTGKLLHTKDKGYYPGSSEDSKPIKLFHDDTLNTFFRRLTFTPDGLLLIAPTGILDKDDKKHENVTWGFSGTKLKNPLLYYTTSGQSSFVVKCCPTLFTLQSDVKTQVTSLPYRNIFAIATKTKITLFDTQSVHAIGIVSNIHYTKITDLAWSTDGRLLMASSTDGYCSLITFTEGELGTIFIPPTNNDNETEKIPDKKN